MAPLPLEQNASAVALVTFVRAFAQVRTLHFFNNYHDKMSNPLTGVPSII